MRYEIRADQFCALASDDRWQSWLSSVATDLCDQLRGHLEKGKGCRSNREFMGILRNHLVERGLGNDMLEHLKKTFPIVLRILPNESIKENKPKAPITYEDMNKHEVFSSYKPHILTFPHKMIMVDQDPESLRRKVRKFTKSKIYTDWVILDDRAYIEYFESRFRKEAEKVESHTREIAIFRRRNSLTGKDKT